MERLLSCGSGGWKAANVSTMAQASRSSYAGSAIFPVLHSAGSETSPTCVVEWPLGRMAPRANEESEVLKTKIAPELMRRGIQTNQQLSLKRAQTVASYLVSQGVNPNLVQAQGFGDADPVAPNNTPAGRAQNRRVEITLAGSGS